VSYFQGLRYNIALVLRVAELGEEWRIFSTEEFHPPTNPEDWKWSKGRAAESNQSRRAGSEDTTGSTRIAASSVCCTGFPPILTAFCQASASILKVGANHAQGAPCKAGCAMRSILSVVFPKRRPQASTLNRRASSVTRDRAECGAGKRTVSWPTSVNLWSAEVGESLLKFRMLISEIRFHLFSFLQ
jgi:hypothetical protein